MGAQLITSDFFWYFIVYVVQFGKWDFRGWAQKPEEKVEEFWKYFEQYVKRHEKDGERNGGEGVVDIVDWDGFSLSHHASKKGDFIV